MSEAGHITTLEAENAHLRARVEQLEHERAELKRLIFGARSERFVPEEKPEQLTLFEEAPAVELPREEVVSAHRRRRKKPVRQALPEHLPREVIVIEPAIDRTELKKIGEEVTETLDYRPAKLIIIRRVRPKYVNPKTDQVLIAELPARPIDKGIAEAGLLASVVIEKYVDHLPIYRQVQRFKREGIPLARSTLEGWVAAVARLLEPLHERLCELVLKSGYVQADETPIPVQDHGDRRSPNKKGKTHRGYYWVYHAPLERLVVMNYQRGRDSPEAFLQGYQGALQSDGYVGYDKFDKQVSSYNCWAHARRYFFEAQDNEPKRAEHALTEIGQLYELERQIADALSAKEATHEERRQVRREKAQPILDRFKVWLDQNRGLPKSPWGKAVTYALGRWDKLTGYVEDGRIEIDNNLVENAIRPIALGRKNYLFAGSHDAAQRAAVIYSLLATCKKHDVNPQEWLSDVLARIPTHPHKQIDELLPHIWKNCKG